MRHIMLLMAVCLSLQPGMAFAADEESRIPVIYCTDLFHPHDDPDDHFDLACMYAIPEFDIKAVILDQGRKQDEKPGRIPVAQLNHLTGRNIPCAIGLADPLDAPDDTGEQQPERYQQGVQTMLTVLRESAAPVTVIAVGSLRDVAAAYNREPELFNNKVSRLYVFIGDAQAGFQEYNVGLDVNAYRRVMNAPLPLYWLPCFDGGLWVNEGNASFWQAKHDVLLADVATPVLNFFIYAMLHKNDDDPVAALQVKPIQEEKERVLADTRNLWCCAIFPYMAHRNYVLRDGACMAIPKQETTPDDTLVEPFSFLPVSIRVDEQGRESYDHAPGAHTIRRFHVNDAQAYAELMTATTRHLLSELR